MRTNIVIDPKLMAEVLRLSGALTRRQLRWTGDLDAMRRDK